MGFGDLIRERANAFLDNAEKKKKKKTTSKPRTGKQVQKGMGATGIIGRAKAKRKKRLDGIMGEIRKTRGK